MKPKYSKVGRPRTPKQIGIQFAGEDLELYDTLVSLAKTDDRTLSSMVRRVLRVSLEDPTLWSLPSKNP